MEKKEFKDDIERAENIVLAVSWVGISTSIALIVYSILGV